MPLRITALVALALACAAIAPALAGAAGIAGARAVDAPLARTAVVAEDGGCPTGVSLDAPAPVQEQAMLCLTNQARERFGEPPLETNSSLEESARDKAADVLRCNSFSHEACGRTFTFWMRETGYLAAECWRAGENLAWGTDEYGTVDSIFHAWMRSETHRENILGNYTQTGIALEVGSLGNLTGTHVWAQHFGSQACAAPIAG